MVIWVNHAQIINAQTVPCLYNNLRLCLKRIPNIKLNKMIPNKP